MSGLCGWFAKDARGRDDAALIGRMAARVPHIATDAVRSHMAGPVGVAVVGPDAEIDIHAGPEVVAAILGRPRWTGAYAEIASREGNAAALAAAFARLGRGLFDVLGGHVCIFAAQPAAGRCVAAIDRHGVHRLCHAAGGGAPVVFGTTTDCVAAHPGIDTAIDPQAVYDCLYFDKVPAPETIYRGQRKLMAAEYLWHEDGRSETAHYWRMPFQNTDRRDTAVLAAELRETVRAAVARATDDLDPAAVGAFLSGGLDSSTVTGMLARLVEKPAKAFSIGFDIEGFDEREYARIAARHFGATCHEYVVTPADVETTATTMAEAYDEPFSNPSGVLVYFCARMALENGVTTLLAGDGGDEIFGGNSRYVEQKYFELYGRAPAWFRNLILEPAVAAFPFGASVPLVRRARGYIEKAKMPLPGRLFVRSIYANSATSRLMAPALLDAVDPAHPVALMRASYDAVNTDSSLQRMLALDTQITLADEDIRKVSTMCEAAGVAVRYPLLDDAVVEFAATVPAEECIKGYKLRHFYREAFRGFLPDATLDKSKHGFGMPFQPWLGDVPRLREMVNDSLSALKKRHLFNDAFLDEALSGRSEELEAQREDVHWTLMMMEMWLRAHEGARGA